MNHSEHCLVCSSENNLLLDEDSHAWECWMCQAKYWIDDLCMIAYMVDNSVTWSDAQQHLNFPDLLESPVVFAYNYGKPE